MLIPGGQLLRKLEETPSGRQGPTAGASACSSTLAELELTRKEVCGINAWARRIARVGGPDDAAAASIVELAVADLHRRLKPATREAMKRYRKGGIAALLFTRLTVPAAPPSPAVLPAKAELQVSGYVHFMAARTQLLLALCAETAFAYDIENNDRIVRVAADFSGQDCPISTIAEVQSSQHGTPLSPHTEGSYHSSQRVVDGHSPAPSSLALSAAWNPLAEPTGLIFTQPILDQLGGETLCALPRHDFMFSRSASYTTGAHAPVATSLLELDASGEFLLRFNHSRASCRPEAPPTAHAALAALREAIEKAQVVQVVLQNDVVCMINNGLVMHLRDQVADPRRTLVRIFGARRELPLAVLRANPRLVRG